MTRQTNDASTNDHAFLPAHGSLDAEEEVQKNYDRLETRMEDNDKTTRVEDRRQLCFRSAPIVEII